MNQNKAEELESTRDCHGAMTEHQQITHMNHLHGHQFEAFLFEPLDDLSNQAPLDTVGLDGNEGALLLVSHDSVRNQKETSRSWKAE